jgi:hypothetical protein
VRIFTLPARGTVIASGSALTMSGTNGARDSILMRTEADGGVLDASGTGVWPVRWRYSRKSSILTQSWSRNWPALYLMYVGEKS